MKPKNYTPPSLDVPTLMDSHGARHITPEVGAAGYCGATGVAQISQPHRIDELCRACRAEYGKQVVEVALRRVGL